MKTISTTKAPAAIGPYSQAIKVGNLLYTSGQLPIDPATGAFPEGGIKERMHAARTGYRQQQDQRMQRELEQLRQALQQKDAEIQRLHEIISIIVPEAPAR